MVTRLMTLVAGGMLLLFLGGCDRAALKDPGSAWFMPPVGSQLQLHQTLEVPPGWARVFLQRGKVVRYCDLDRYYPSCNVELKAVTQAPQTIGADAFDVTRVAREAEGAVHYSPWQYANVQAGGSVDSGSRMEMHVIHLWLASERQPDVLRLTCRGALDDEAKADRPGFSDIEEALGQIATLRLATP